MTRDNKGPRKSFSKGSSSDFGKKRSFSNSDKPKRSFKSEGSSFKKRDGDSSEKRSYGKREGGYGDSDKKSFGSKSFTKKADGKYESTDKKSFGSRERKPYGEKSFDSGKKSFTKRADGKYESADGKNFGSRERKPYGEKSFDSGKKSFTKKSDGKYESTDKKSFGSRDKKPFGEKSYRKHSDDSFEPREKKPYGKREDKDFGKKAYEPKLSKAEKTVVKSKKAGPKKTSTQQNVSDDAVRLNRYLANAGICSRREADVLIATGVVTVNGKIVTEMGYKVNPTDVVTYGGVPIKNETKKYLLLNKPKDYITTMDDPQERRTVMELIRNACRERLYPVGRLDRNTTGVLLFTNDGDMTAKLTHPKFEVRKVYHVTLNKKMTSEDYRMLNEGIELSDGFIKPDAAEFVGAGKFELGVEIHSGKNRIVRRMFEHLGYEVIKLDRVAFAGLTKKDLPRGKFRFLTEKEIGFLKMLG